MIRIVEVDYDDPSQSVDLIAMLDAYARDPMGGGRPLPEEVKQRLISGLKAHPAACSFLAYLDDKPVGLVNCYLGFSTFAGRPLLNIHDLAVIPEARRMGIARRLLDAVRDKARALGCCKLALEVRDDNPAAQRLYQRYGFHDGGIPHRYWHLNL